MIKRVKLSDIADLITKGTTPTTLGYEFVDEGINFLKIECFREDGSFLRDKVAHISKKCNDKLKRSQLKSGDILFSIAGAIGRVSIVDENMLPANINQALAIIRISNVEVFLPYIRLILTSQVVKKQFEKKKQGVAQLNLSLKDIGEIVIPLPNMEKQVKYSNIFKKVTSILSKRYNQLEDIDNLIKSRFVEMFGDPKINPKGWEEANLGAYLDVLTDYHSNGSYETLRDNVTLLDIPSYALMVRTTDLEKNNFEDDVKYIDEHAYNHLEKSKVFGGEIIINKIGSAGKVYLMPYLNRPVSLAMNQFLLRFNKDILNNVFIYHLLNTPYCESKIQDRVRGAVTKTITKDAVREVEIYVPPIHLQNQFATFVEQVDKLKVTVQESLNETQILFDSLMQKYFG
ncbi:restriction endonuclease subunit S [Aminipila terrae]|uniref:Restriction endonuclease subunit S n=1 Tax=Aminipila terrae TaxID=2697030 RepID=A0A6P1MFK5_9FIRM|nr:restriction endonuclease subunit S [Aminipila terrae]QHI72687.1 restriction endonuclease subunit S [Aminipila terrae]